MTSGLGANKRFFKQIVQISKSIGKKSLPLSSYIAGYSEFCLRQKEVVVLTI